MTHENFGFILLGLTVGFAIGCIASWKDAQIRKARKQRAAELEEDTEQLSMSQIGLSSYAEDTRSDEEILRGIEQGIDDATVMHAPEMCNKETRRETMERICKNGGTLAYYAALARDVRELGRRNNDSNTDKAK